MDMRQIVGRNIRRYRQIAKLSQEEVAGRMNVAQGYLSGLEAGQRNPTVTMLGLAAEALGVRVTQLVDESGSQSSPSKTKARSAPKRRKRRLSK
jgi:transcriptional regulator with XRE-family HTH domain